MISPTDRTLRTALIAIAFAFVAVHGGYQIGKQMAHRDAAPAAAAS